MPFTFSHPAAIIPFLGKNSRLSSSGLLIGSVVPDFEKFIRMNLKGDFSESLIGILLFDLPLSLFLLFLFHLVIRDKLILFLPHLLYLRFEKSVGYNWNLYFKKRWFVVIYSVLFGILTHLFWDSFTHYDGFISLYFYDFFYFKLLGVSVFNIIQFISSIGGLIIVGSYIYKKDKPKGISTIGYKRNKYWVLVTVLCFSAFIIRWYFGFNRFEEIIVSLIASFMWAVLFGSVLVRKPTAM